MKRKVLKFKDFKPIIKFLKNYNLTSFTNKKKIQRYMDFFELNYLLKKIPQDKLKNISATINNWWSNYKSNLRKEIKEKLYV